MPRTPGKRTDPATSIQGTRSVLPLITVPVEGVGHAPFLESPEEFDRYLARFIHRAPADSS